MRADRKTAAVADRHNLGAFATARWTDVRAPFFAEAKVASTKTSLRSILPRSRRSSTRRCTSSNVGCSRLLRLDVGHFGLRSLSYFPAPIGATEAEPSQAIGATSSRAGLP